MTMITNLPLLRITQTALLSVALLMASQGAFSQEQQPHVHGVAELHVVLEGNQLEIELHSPAMNLLGFEYQANNAKQYVKVDDVKALLAKAGSLFQFQPSTCELTGHQADFSGVIGDKNQEKNRQEHKEHDAHHESISHHKDEHTGQGDQAHDHEEEERHHSDIVAHYQFVCKTPGELRLMTTDIPTTFPGVHSLNAQWIINGRQGAIILDKQQRDIPFR